MDEQIHAQERHQIRQRPGEGGAELEVAEQQHRDERRPDLDSQRVGGGADESLDLQVLLQGLEKQLDLPPLLVDAGDGDRGELAIPILLLASLIGAVAFLCYEIGANTASATLGVAAFKDAIRKEIELRFRAEQQLSQEQREEIATVASDAKTLATQALRRPSPPVVLAVKTPVPVQIVEPPTPAPTIADTNPKHGGLLDRILR